MNLLPALQHPEWLPALLAAWLLLALAVAGAGWRARLRAGRLGLAGPARARFARDALLLAALLALGLALLGPRIGTRSERLSTAGVDLIVLVDVSRSMDARDLPPSRLDRARQAGERLLAGLAPGDRAALAAFAGRGVVLTPLTHDFAALTDLLPALDTSLMRPAASRLGEGMRAALSAFDAGSERPRVVVVLSDGEDPDGKNDLGLAETRRAGARVVAVALGTEAGATIEDQGLALRDRRGRIVTTRLDAARLASLAHATDGVLLRPDPLGAVGAAALRAAVRRDAPPPGDATGTIERRVPAVRTLPLAIVALLLLAFEAGAGARSAARGPASNQLATALAAAALVVAASLPARGGDDVAKARAQDELAMRDAHALLARGFALAEDEQWAEAERAFLAAALAAREPRLAADAYHDAGVAALRARRLEAARDAFFESLAVTPSPDTGADMDTDMAADVPADTRFNLEWTLRALAAQEPPPSGAAEPNSDADETQARPDPDAAEPPSRPNTNPPPVAPPPLSDEEAERWLARAGDDPARALGGHRDEGPPASRVSAW